MNRSYFLRALNDIALGAEQWRVWTLLAMSEMRGRYRRSTIGPFWITLSMAATIACLGLVYAAIFKLELAVYLPLMATSFICWSFIASLVNESSSVFIENENYLRSSNMPRSVFIYKVLLRNILFFGHNLILIPLVMVIFGITPTLVIFLFIPAVILSILTAFWLGMLLGILSIRYRDFAPIVGNIVQVAFFVSPVIWGRPQLGSEHQWIIDFNPFAVYLELLRGPILGTVPDLKHWLTAIGITLFGYAIAIPFYARFRPRLSFYV